MQINNLKTANQVKQNLEYLMNNELVQSIMISSLNNETDADKIQYCVKIFVNKPNIDHKDLEIKTVYEKIPVIIEFGIFTLL